ncbi:MAG: methyltransferase domain-containing protein [Woeseiaceae bacterium]|nr:methyltransferase domain-containing protein [Woeseiaceae bacterium]
MKRHWTRKYGEGFEGHTLDSTLIEAALRKSLVEGTVFEIGAGTGYFTKVMEGWGYDVAATDLVVGDTMDITKERRGEYDNVVAIGVLHHILEIDDLRSALENIKAMATKKISLAVKLPSEDIRKRSRHANRYGVLDYIGVLGSPVTVTECGYLSMLEWEVGADA